MRSVNLNITATPQQFFQPDKNRGVFIIRNKDAANHLYLQFGYPSSTADGFELLPGDTLTLDRGDLSESIWIWADGATALNNIMIG